LAALGRERGALVLHDLGSGALRLPEGLTESTAARSLLDGADLVMVSGDKLLGGPQAGILLGRREPLDLCRKHPLARALRADRMLLAALEGTLQLYRSGRGDELPINAALGATPSELSQRATRLALELQQRGVPCAVVESEGRVGGGSIPLARLPGHAVAVDGGPELLEELRRGDPPVVALLRDGRVLLDVRCAGEVGELAAAASAAWSRAGGQARSGARLGESYSGA
jgi:L-seryl-tRNA(Ser) seleniumtransferase